MESLLPQERSKVLVIAGDLGHYNEQNYNFLKSLTKYYTHILVVAGNHDYYLVNSKKRYKHQTSMKRWSNMKALASHLEGVHFDGSEYTDPIDGKIWCSGHTHRSHSYVNKGCCSSTMRWATRARTTGQKGKSQIYRWSGKSMIEDIEMKQRPYWIRACTQAEAPASRRIGLGELFVIVLDRLETYGIDIRSVSEAFASLAEEIGRYGSGELNEDDIRFRDLSDDVGRFAALLQTRSSEREYARLKELSAGILDRIAEASERIGLSVMDPEPFVLSAARLRQRIERVIHRMKDEVLHAHPAYFKSDGWVEPVQLGYLVYCVHVLEQAVERLHMPFAESAAETSGDTDGAASELLADLLDWTGDYEQLEYVYWRQELNEIMGVE